MNKEEKKKSYLWIVLLLIIGVGVISSVSLIKFDDYTSKTPKVSKNNNANKKEIKLENFSNSLSKVMFSSEYNGGYDALIEYSGVYFNFKCLNDECNNINAIAKINDSEIPLFEINEANYNYLENKEDIYFILKDNFFVVSYLNKDEHIDIYDINGNLLKKISDYKSSYIEQGFEFKKIYPSIKDNNLIYYTCNKNTMNTKELNLTDLVSENILDSVSPVTCNK